ncbi:XXYS1_4_G0022250.mRNA.1.CDS.1 [Saccharomyces cerevisiae]|nr:EM14S01-3B_G0019750.mRNA.1.CDS.1 [Saccharomyces cerevisiae]CAD6650162.1 XXYS1_4_G0022250.mRNA.1.CDS.1 [Saccharomyces cerevisiae]CAI4845754.1 CEI_1a_G0055360.mRNA.1.CDS.1 [Saccharomyces cerevisiae]CAI4851401.1 AMH_1a_G0055500.mRNA.1.CDS.1 [Saccharomyces cerevisiae]CAI6909509.1 AMH_1a_G0055500.mRNA.1.CDS.1 [Saccharomyces cerevisiae]
MNRTLTDNTRAINVAFNLGAPQQRTIFAKERISIPGYYEIIQFLGKGAYGTVCSVKFKGRSPAARIAVKKISNIFNKEILLKRAIRELKFMNFFKGHKNIVNLIDLEIVTSSPYDGLYCYQELIDYDLAKVIHSSVQLSEFHIKYFLYQILCGLKYIHSADVIHRDLKPGNILCTLNGCLKICDFGLARGIHAGFFKCHSTVQPHITNYVATRWYRAPELLLSNQPYSKSVDIWAVGCILAEFYARKPVFMGRDSMHQIFEIIKVLGTPDKDILIKFGTIKAWNLGKNSNNPVYKKIPWSNIFPFASHEAINLIESLLHWDSTHRLNVEQAISHPFLNEVRKPDDEPVCLQGPFDFTYESELDSMSKLRDYLVEEVKNFKTDLSSSSL